MAAWLTRHTYSHWTNVTPLHIHNHIGFGAFMEFSLRIYKNDRHYPPCKPPSRARYCNTRSGVVLVRRPFSLSDITSQRTYLHPRLIFNACKGGIKVNACSFRCHFPISSWQNLSKRRSDKTKSSNLMNIGINIVESTPSPLLPAAREEIT